MSRLGGGALSARAPSEGANRELEATKKRRKDEENPGDQGDQGHPASRGTETSAEVLVGPPWRMESNAGQQQWYEEKTPVSERS
jgi:hypothetical protein